MSSAVYTDSREYWRDRAGELAVKLAKAEAERDEAEKVASFNIHLLQSLRDQHADKLENVEESHNDWVEKCQEAERELLSLRNMGIVE